MKFFAVRQALDGDNLRAVFHHRQRQTAIDPLAIDEHRAGAALAMIAAFLGAGKVQALAQQVEQSRPRSYRQGSFDAVDRECDGNGLGRRSTGLALAGRLAGNVLRGGRRRRRLPFPPTDSDVGSRRMT